MRSNEVQSIVLPAINISKLRVAEPDSVLQHGLEHRLEIARGPTDDLEHLRRRRLLLQRFGEFRVRCCSASNSRTFSIAMTAWSAKVSISLICFSVNGWTVDRVSVIAPIGTPLLSKGTESTVR